MSEFPFGPQEGAPPPEDDAAGAMTLPDIPAQDPDDGPEPLLVLDSKCGKLVQEDGPLGATRMLWHPEEQKKIELWLAKEIELAKLEWAPVFAECVDNIRTYRAEKIQASDGKTMVLPAPLALVVANQQIAYAYNAILRPRPIVSIDPYFPAVYDIVVPVKMNQMTGAPTSADDPAGIDQPTLVPRSADEIAESWEQGLEFKLREKYGFPDLVYSVVTDSVLGAAPTWVKVWWERKTRSVMQPKRSGGTVNLGVKIEMDVQDGEPLCVQSVPVFNCLLRINETDVEKAPWFAESIPCSPEDFLAEFDRGNYFLLGKDEDKAKKLSQNTSERLHEYREQIETTTQKKTAAEPIREVDTKYVWFFWYVTEIVSTTDPETGVVKKKKRKRKLSFLSEVHSGGTVALLNSFRNPNDSQERQYTAFFQMKDPHAMSGSSCVGTVKYHQRVKTHALNAEIMNAHQANNFSYRYDPNAPIADKVDGGFTLRPGEGVGATAEEFDVFRVGAAHDTMLPLISYLDADGMIAGNENDFKLGNSIPGRTPAQTVAQVLEQGAQQPLMMLRTICGGSQKEGFLRVIRHILLTEKQYQPMGETIHIQDPETREMIDVLYRHPVEDVLDNFRFAFTAVDEAEAAAHEAGQSSALQQLMTDNNKEIAEISVLVINPQTTPAMMDLGEKMMLRSQIPLEMQVRRMRRDVAAFTLTPEIKALVAERKAALLAMQQQQAAMAAQGGAPNAQAQVENAGQPGAVAGPLAAPVPGGGGAVGTEQGQSAPPPPPPPESGPPAPVM